MPEQDYTDADRFSEMRRIIHPDTAEEPWRWGNVRTVVSMLIDEVEQHNVAIGALRVMVSAREEEGHGMTRQDLIGDQPSPMLTHLAAAAIGAPVGSPEHLDELRTALADARRELGTLFLMRHERDEARRENRKLRRDQRFLIADMRQLIECLSEQGQNVVASMLIHKASETLRVVEGPDEDESDG